MAKFHGIKPKVKQSLVWYMLALVLVFLVVVVFSSGWFFGKKYLRLNCHTDLYTAPFTLSPSNEVLNQYLALDVELLGEQVSLNYHYGIDGKEISSILYRGKVSGLEAGAMTYKLDLLQADINMDLAQSTLPPIMRDALNEAREAFIQQGQMSLNLQIVDRDSQNDFTLIKFYPSGNLWACTDK